MPDLLDLIFLRFFSAEDSAADQNTHEHHIVTQRSQELLLSCLPGEPGQ